MSTTATADEGAPRRSPSEWLDAVVEAERRGELLSACDIADQGLDEPPGDVPSSAAWCWPSRAGSTEQAARRFERYGLRGVGSEDVRALEARIAKDVALAATRAERSRHATRSAALYEAIFADTHGYYPGINAATLRLVSGDESASRRLAQLVLDIALGRHHEGYYSAATEAEAHLLLDNVPRASSALDRAAALHGSDYGAVATTRRQLELATPACRA